jgi:hypothetical protein
MGALGEGRAVRDPVRFGRPAAAAVHGGRSAHQVAFPSIRMPARDIDGKRVEIFLIPNAGKDRGIAGVIVRVDGTTRQMLEFDEGTGRQRLGNIRMVTYDAEGRHLADVDADVSQLSPSLAMLGGAPSGDGLLAACGAWAGRMAGHVADALLPATLHAQSGYPCQDQLDAMVLAGITLAGAASAAAYQVALCAGTLFTCPAAVLATGAAATLAAAYYYLAYRYYQCRDALAPCGQFENDPCPGDPGYGGGSGGSGGGGGPPPSDVGGFTQSGWNPGNDGGVGTYCGWYTTSWVEYGVHYTNSTFACF